MKKQLLVLLLFCCSFTYAQTISLKTDPGLIYGQATKVGISPERLARIDTMINKAIIANEIPGAVVLISRKGKIVYHKAFGMSDNVTGRSMNKDAIFRIVSQTKAITSTALMMLWEEGRFQLDDPIAKYIPEFKNATVLDSFIEADSSFIGKPTKNPITIRQLLTHTSGIGYGFIDDGRFRKLYQKAGIVDGFTTSNTKLKDNILNLAKLPLHFEPGTQFSYSEGLDVLGYLIEILSGMPLDQYFQKRIFEPLEMHDTYFYLPDSKTDRLVTVQTKLNGKWVKYTDNPYYDPDYPVKGSKTFFSGGAGLSSTAKDYANFLQMFLNKGVYKDKRLLSRTTVELMMKNQTGELFNLPGSYYGLAFAVIDNSGETIGGTGSEGTFWWGGYFNTSFFADPKEELIGIFMKQTEDIQGDDTYQKFTILVEQAVDD